MSIWPKDDLRKIASTDDLHISPFREDGVTFEPVDGAIHDLIDEGYRQEYRSSPYLNPTISARARAATVKVMTRETNT